MLTSNISLSTPVCHWYIIIWLVFACFVSSQIRWQSESASIFCTNDIKTVMSHMMSFIIPFLSILSIWRCGGLTAVSKYYMVIIKMDIQLSQPVKLASKHWWSHFSALSWKVIVRIKNEIMAIKLIGWSILEKWLKRLFYCSEGTLDLLGV